MLVAAGQPHSRTDGQGLLGSLGLAYFRTFLLITVSVALASLFRHESPVGGNVSFWLSLTTFSISIVSTRLGLIAAVLLLALSPALHEQLNVLLGMRLQAWTYPGVDCMVGFIAAWAVRGGLASSREALRTFPAGGLLALHAWIALSATVAIGRNLWQSASEFSWRGFASYTWLIRRIGLQDDYLPLQDLFYFSVALIVFVAGYGIVRRDGERTFRHLVWVLLVGAAGNAVFVIWQQVTGKGWFAGVPGVEFNSLWPDLHSFAGFMALAAFAGAGLLATRKLSGRQWGFTFALIGAAVAGLLISGSRSTLLITALLLTGGLLLVATTMRGWGRVSAAGAGLFVLGALVWIFKRGYRGVSFESLQTMLRAISIESLNRALSYRPEIWVATLDMYSQFPIFGLGEGALFRLSSNPSFANSRTIESLAGSGAHNYFLQFFVELGPVGLGIALLVAAPFLRLGRQNLRLASFYALLGIAASNVYAHSLLTREMLMLLAVFSATYVWEAQTLTGEYLRPLSATTVCRSVWILAVVATLAMVDAALSFGRFPFTYGQRCFAERPLTWDHWVEGSLRMPLPEQTTAVSLTLAADRKDVPRRRLEVEIAVVDGAGDVGARRVVVFDQVNDTAVDLALPVDTAVGRGRALVIRASNCYVPLNVGRGHDGRHLGVRLRALEIARDAD